MTALVRRYGRRALLVEPGDPGEVLPLLAAARELPGVVEAVPAARTFLLQFADTAAAASAAARLPDLEPTRPPREQGRDTAPVVLDVRYDGPDLDAVAARTGLSVTEVVATHAAPDYVVAFCGFAPGFAYLTGLPPALQLPRRAEPRSTVPAGSVGVAGEFTGVYPRSSPGGWQLLGRTTATLWDPAAASPALLAPGTRVRFRPV
jgi:KipI family sensor histidine kinase inhibitor